MKVPLLDLNAQLDGMRDEILTAVTKVIDSTRYIQGPEVEGLEQSIASYCGTGYGVGVSSGTDALLISLMSLGIGPGDLVLTTPYSFFATMGVILRVGAQPVFADIDPVTYNIDPEAVEELLVADKDRNIKAILPVHLYGQCADMKPLLQLAEKYDLPVIEDAAQAIGAEYPLVDSSEKKWLRAGSMGFAGCFSFFPSKNLGGIGDGGMVVTNDRSFAEKLSLMRNHGAHPKYFHSLVGGNFRLDPIQATVLRIKLKHLEEWHQSRRNNASVYNRLFAESGLQSDKMVSTPQAVYMNQKDGSDPSGKNFHIFNQYILRVKKRDQLKDWLQRHNVGCEIYYPLALHQQECLGSEFTGVKFPHAEGAAAQTIALPIYPELTFPMQEYVVQTIVDFYKQA
jgi:dTDP-4-amino-4,6-dideoxygalactose transaminase